jgi:hypothetical protein
MFTATENLLEALHFAVNYYGIATTREIGLRLVDLVVGSDERRGEALSAACGGDEGLIFEAYLTYASYLTYYNHQPRPAERPLRPWSKSGPR